MNEKLEKNEPTVLQNHPPGDAVADGLAVAEVIKRDEPLLIEIDLDLPEAVDVTAFGQRLSLLAPRYKFLRSDSQWRLHHIYQPALTSQTLAAFGVALDIGAGFGVFALPFAKAFPAWKVFCFEPDQESFTALHQNILKLGLANVIALPFAIGSSSTDCPQDADAVRHALLEIAAGKTVALGTFGELLPLADYSRSKTNLGYVERGINKSSEYEIFRAPTLAAAFLTALAPRLLKLVAPTIEKEIIADLAQAELDHVIGESWSHIPSFVLSSGTRGHRQTWLPRAGHPILGLRQSHDPSGRPSRLDVVVAMYNCEHHIGDCLSGILESGLDDIHVLVVDDGSTDASSDLVFANYYNDPRVTLLRKPNGGCSSARNYGRMHSKASHIAFVDADGVPGADLFEGLLDLARHTGAEIVQGGFHLLTDDGVGGWTRHASAESTDEKLTLVLRHDLGDRTCHFVPSAVLMEGQTSIWRRVYRRDFLENRKIWFPEHIKSFGDHIFQMLTLQCVYDVPVLDGVTYGHRQEPEKSPHRIEARAFYGLEMFRILLKCGVRDGWNDFTPILKFFAATINRTAPKLSADLRITYIKGAGELWGYARKTLGADAFGSVPYSAFDPIDFEHYARHQLEKLQAFDDSYCWSYLDSLELHAPFLNLPRRK